MIRGIHHVAVHVRDMDRMMKFYKDAFGFEVVGEPFELGGQRVHRSHRRRAEFGRSRRHAARRHLLHGDVPVQRARRPT